MAAEVAGLTAEGGFGIVSGNSYQVLEKLRRMGVYSTSRIAGMAINPSISSGGNIYVMYYTAGRKVLSSLINWYRFDKRTGDYVYDLGDRGHTATLTASGVDLSGTNVYGVSGTLVFGIGASGTAGAFNKDAYVSLTVASGIMLPTGTVCAWINRASDLSGSTIYSYSKPEDVNAYCKFSVSEAGKCLNYVHRPQNDYIDSKRMLTMSGTTAMSSGTWYHVAATSDGSTVRLYVNGDEEAISYISGTNAGQWFSGSSFSSGVYVRRIGAHTSSGVEIKGAHLTDQFTGRMYDFRLASYPFSKAQLQAIHSTGV